MYLAYIYPEIIYVFPKICIYIYISNGVFAYSQVVFFVWYVYV